MIFSEQMRHLSPIAATRMTIEKDHAAEYLAYELLPDASERTGRELLQRLQLQRHYDVGSSYDCAVAWDIFCRHYHYLADEEEGSSSRARGATSSSC